MREFTPPLSHGIICLCAVFLIGISSAHAGTATWTGATNSNWATGTNWTGGTGTGGAPGSSDTAIINSGSVGATISTANAVAGTVEIGTSATGALGIQSGGRLSDNIGYAGYGTGSTGTVTVTGTGSTWMNSSSLTIGSSGTGTLNIQNGGTVDNTLGYLGGVGGSTGTATVSGAGSSWVNSSGLYIGNAGSGTFNIESGGTVSDTTGYIGNAAGSTGTVTVTGSGSSWTNSNYLYVGYLGSNGSLNILDGATVTSASARIGVGSGTDSLTSGSTVIDGNGSAWNITGAMLVGYYGSGTLTISNGGALNDASVEIGTFATGIGTATVTGAGSIWTTTGSLDIGYNGNGTVNIQNGGTVNDASGYIGSDSGSRGTVTVTGRGSSWANSNALFVGSDGNGILNIEDGGAVTSNLKVVIGNSGSGTAIVSGPGSSLTSGGALYVGNNDTGTLTVEDGGGAIDATGYISNGTGSIGTATVTGDGSSWTNSGTLTVGNRGIGTLTIGDGGTVSASSVAIAQNAGATGTLNIGAAAGNAPAAPGTLTASTVTFGSGSGTLVFNHTSLAYVFTPAITGTGTIDALAGNTLLAGDLSQFSGAISVAPGANLSSGAQQQASMQALAARTQAAMIESRAVGNELLGFARPMTDDNAIYAESMFGSAEGLMGGQISKEELTVLGGMAYGHQDFTGLTEDDAPTVAAAVRYTFDGHSIDDLLRLFDRENADGALHPYVELGGWVTPDDRYSFTRSYGTFDGAVSAMGNTRGMQWAEYARLGMRWDIDRDDQVTSYGEIGQQRLRYGSYTEQTGPFPAVIDGGVMRFDIARFGGSYTRNLKDLTEEPLSFTLSGGAAHAFDTHADMAASIGSVSFPGAAGNQTWGEFGATLNMAVTDDITASLGITGTTGAGLLGTSVHGIAGVGYKF